MKDTTGDWDFQESETGYLSWFPKLPIDILRYFLQTFVQDMKDVHSLMSTSKGMYRLILTLDFWVNKTVRLSHEHEVKSIAFERFKTLKTLTLVGSPSDTHVFSFLSAHLESVETIIVQHAIHGRDLTTLVQSCPNLSNLVLENGRLITDSDLNKVTKQVPSLERFSISLAHRLTENTVHHLSVNCANLSELGMEVCPGLCNLTPFFGLKKLTKLSLSGSNITDAGLRYFTACDKLKHLELIACNNISSEGVKGILEKCKEIKHLDVSQCTKVSDDTFASIDQLSLEVVDFRGCPITDLGVGRLAKASRNLKTLDLTLCFSITDQGIFEIVSQCPSLNSLSINFNSKISTKSLDHVAAWSSRLNKLSLQGCAKLTSTAISKLADKCKRIQQISF